MQIIHLGKKIYLLCEKINDLIMFSYEASLYFLAPSQNNRGALSTTN